MYQWVKRGKTGRKKQIKTQEWEYPNIRLKTL